MNYGNRDFEYTIQAELIDVVDSIDEYAESNQPKHARKRSAKALRKRGRKRSGSHPGCGIAGRRNRQYSW